MIDSEEIKTVEEKQFDSEKEVINDEKDLEKLKESVDEKNIDKTDLATTGDELLGLRENIFAGTDEMLVNAKNRISKYRLDMKGKKKLGGNLGYLEGELNGVPIDNKIVSSGPNFDNPDIFDPKYVNNSNEIKPGPVDGAYLRTTDSEFQMLSDLAKEFKLERGHVYDKYTGTIKVVSELPYCGSCSGVIDQFSKMLPNVKIILVNGTK